MRPEAWKTVFGRLDFDMKTEGLAMTRWRKDHEGVIRGLRTTC